MFIRGIEGVEEKRGEKREKRRGEERRNIWYIYSRDKGWEKENN